MLVSFVHIYYADPVEDGIKHVSLNFFQNSLLVLQLLFCYFFTSSLLVV
ncbi:hypothetical protein AAKU67_001094 [Oxalobacteraceae bacterium GrIS 2.11]